MDEGSELLELIERHERATACKTKVAVADSRYGNTANFIALAQRQIRAHVADLRSKLRNPRSEGIYPPERLFINPQPTATDARRERSFLGTTLWRVAAITSIAPSREPARGADSGSSARVIRTDAP